MLVTLAATAALLAGVLAESSTSYNNSTGTSGFTAVRIFPLEATEERLTSPKCDALRKAGLGDRLLFPTDAGYEPQIETWWAKNSRLRPYCLVLPHSTDEVSTAFTALVDVDEGAGDWHIAIRSGGHGWPGANNIINGVTIDLTMMNSSSYDAETNIASIQPGGHWENVFADLQKYNVTVTGGRDGAVGVGGFLLGGGNSFFSGRMGFGCDSVVNFEVVLANGTVINANRTAHSDLWRALKGGGSNFGIVTRFDMEAIPSKDLYYDLRSLSSNYSDAIVNAVAAFTDQDRSLADNALVVFYTHDTSISPDIVATAISVNTQGEEEKTVFSPIQDLPALYNMTVRQNMAEAAMGSHIPAGTRNTMSTLTFRNDPKIMRRCVELHQEMVEAIKLRIDPADFTAHLFFQPIPSYFGTIGKERGGNMLGLDRVDHNAILWTSGVLVKSDEAANAVGQTELLKTTARVKEMARSMNGDVEFVYLNYASPSQDPLGSYGMQNIQYMRDVAARYDPAGIIQTRVPGGFKISRVA
ncbi:hypothetical protein FQN49_008026 [Arthroderma sp. PD_2]|nr:hypothetical protein FQN49_008026 [Arthroderma sp. PD_2]